MSLVATRGTPLRAALDEPVPPQARMLFDHCTSLSSATVQISDTFQSL